MDRPAPVVALAGAAPWAEPAAALLRAGGFNPLPPWPRRAGYIEHLADHYAALILADGDDPRWHDWAVLPRQQQATRRMPVLVVASSAERRAEALAAGADAVLAPDDLAARLVEQARALARVPDAARLAELDCQCAEDLPLRARLGVEKFNAGEYYAQHDLFETQWMEEPGPVRDLYRAILQVGVAYYHIQRGNTRGALKMLLRCVQWLAVLPDVCQGIDVRQLREDAAQVRAALEALGPDEIAAFDSSLLKPLRRVER